VWSVCGCCLVGVGVSRLKAVWAVLEVFLLFLPLGSRCSHLVSRLPGAVVSGWLGWLVLRYIGRILGFGGSGMGCRCSCLPCVLGWWGFVWVGLVGWFVVLLLLLVVGGWGPSSFCVIGVGFSHCGFFSLLVFVAVFWTLVLVVGLCLGRVGGVLFLFVLGAAAGV